MDNTLNLETGQEYKVVKAFIDFDGYLHEIGERWIYLGTNFHPYDDGLTLHVQMNGEPVVYRLQWLDDAQGGIIEHFEEYVERIID